MQTTEGSASALVDRLLADPPAVHQMAAGPDADVGLWATDRACYHFIAEHVGPATRTLETGSGLSTVLFAALGAHHTCVTPARVEADRILDYCTRHDIGTTDLTFEIDRSDVVLPRLASQPAFDLVLVDGNHGFPTPMIDWYYGASRLVPGGICILDDVALPAVAHLRAFVDDDPRFALAQQTEKWVAYRHTAGGDLGQDWFEQPWYHAPAPAGLAALPGRAVRKAGRMVRKLR